MTDGDGRPYSPTYLRSITNQMSAIMNHAVRLYGLRSNPMHKVERIGSKRADRHGGRPRQGGREKMA